MVIELKNILNEANYSKIAIKKLEDELGQKETEKMLDVLDTWVGDSDSSSANYLYKNFETFKKLKKTIPYVFTPKTPNGTTLYRGLTSPSKELKEFAKTAQQNKEKFTAVRIGGNTWYKYKKKISYNPHLNCQSWTDSFTSAFRFADRSFDNDFQTMLCTDQDNNFLFNTDFIRSIAPEFASNEKELIHFGKEYPKGVYLMIRWIRG